MLMFYTSTKILDVNYVITLTVIMLSCRSGRYVASLN